VIKGMIVGQLDDLTVPLQFASDLPPEFVVVGQNFGGPAEKSHSE